jgi:hypothetical protein
VPDARVATARKGVLQVKLTSETTYRDLQFDLQLPKGISLVKAAATPEEPDVANVKVGAEGHVIAYNAVDGGKVRFAVYDPSKGKTFTKDVLIEIPVQASEEFTEDDVAHVTDMVASSNDDAATSNTIRAFDFNIIWNLLGDVDENGAVEVTDVLLTADVVLNEGVAPANFKNRGAGDIELNDVINVTDVLGIADIVLSGSNHAKEMMEDVEPSFVDTLDPQ